MQLLEAIFIKPHGIFLKTILNDQDLTYEDVEGFLKMIDEDLKILLPQMTYVKKRIKRHKNRLTNAKWYECRITLTHLIDCMVQVLPVIQAALNDSIRGRIFDNSDSKSLRARPVELNPFTVDPKKIIRLMKGAIEKRVDKKKSQLDILSNAAELFSSMILICNRGLKTMITAEFGSL
jgi:hypothetical protein